MKKYVENSLKRYLKKRKRITEALVVVFMMTGSLGYASFEINSVNQLDDGVFLISPEDEYTNGIDVKLDDVTIRNKGAVKSYNNQLNQGVYSNLGNGIQVDSALTNVNINNTGAVLGEFKGDTTSSTSEDNTSLESQSSGNGLIGDVGENVGIVSGKAEILTGSTPVYVPNKPTKLTSSTTSKLMESGNGILGKINSNIGSVIGFINIETGKADSRTRSPTAPNLNAYSYSLSNLELSGNGGISEVKDNSGVIKGGINIKTGDAYSSSASGGNVNSMSHSYTQLVSEKSGNGILGVIADNTGVLTGLLNIETGKAETLSTSTTPTINFAHPFAISTTFLNLKESGNGVIGIIGENAGTTNGTLNIKAGDAIVSGSTKAPSGAYSRTEGFTYLSVSSSGNGVYGEIESNEGTISGSFNGIAGDLKLEALSSVGHSGNLTSMKHEAHSSLFDSGNGVYGEIESNSGVATGNIKVDAGSFSKNGGVKWNKDYVEKNFSGSGMAHNGALTKDVVNSGILAGSESAIALQDGASHTGSISNYGILAGREIISDGREVIANDNTSEKDKALSQLDLAVNGITYNGVGIEIKLNNDDDRTIESITRGSGGDVVVDGETFTVLNADIHGADSYNEVSSDTVYTNHIINGAGVASGTLTVKNSEVTLDNSIVNGYEKAVTLNGESGLTATDTIFNGGGIGKWNDNGTPDDNMDDFLEHTNVVEGDSGDNVLNILGNSVVNGDIDLGDGTDKLTVSTNTQLNGSLYGGEGEDYLALGDTPLGTDKTPERVKEGLNIYHTVSGFEDISITGGVTLYETAKVIGAENINIESDSSLNLRIDPTETDAEGRVTGHALYGSDAIISGAENTVGGIEADTDGGTLNLITNGLGRNSVIAMSDDKDHQVTIESGTYVRTDSIINSAGFQEDGDIVIKTGEDLDRIFNPIEPPTQRPSVDPIEPPTVDPIEPPTVDPIEPPTVDPIDPDRPDRPDWVGDNKYKKLDLVYKSIVSSNDDNINALYPTVNLWNKTTDEAGENLLLLLNEVFMANPYGYISQTSRESLGLFNEMVLNNPFKPNKKDWMIYGGLTYGEGDYDSSYRNYMSRNYYGFDTKNDNVSTDSKVYGAYALAEYGISDKTSAGFILGGANSDVNISNGSKIEGSALYLGAYGKTEVNNFRFTAGAGYQYGDYETTRIAGNKYQRHEYEKDIQTNGVTAYAEAAYNYALNSKWSLEPKVRLSYMRLKQDSVDEGGSALAIEADSKTTSYWDTESGVDLVREITYSNSKAHLKAGVSYLYSLEGHEEDYVTGRMKNGSNFDILMPEQDKDRVKVKASYDVEHESGLIYNIGGGYITGSDTDQYYAGVGIGFKFNKLKDLIPSKAATPQEIKPSVVEAEPEYIEVAIVESLEDEEGIDSMTSVVVQVIEGFEVNSSTLTKEMKEKLDEVALQLREEGVRKIKVIGHTDSSGPKRFNDVLSEKRAEAAKERLLVTLNEVEIFTEGVGSNDPIENNETIEGREINRRVEVSSEG